MAVLYDDFLEYMELQRRCSPLTLRNYKRDLELFAEWLRGEYGDTATLECATTEQIREWIIYRMEGGERGEAPLSPSSMNRTIATLRSAYRFGEERGYVKRSPTRSIKALKAPKPLPHFVPQNKMSELLTQNINKNKTSDEWITQRNELLIAFIYLTGLRLSEVASLREESFSADYKQVKVLGKGNKERIVPIIPELRDKILSHFSEIKPLNIWKRSSNCLFLSKQGRPLSASMIYKIIRGELQRGDVSGRKSPHVLRHTFATHLLNGGGEIRVIQELLGHTSLQATQRYTHNSIATLKSSYAKSHPRGGAKNEGGERVEKE